VSACHDPATGRQAIFIVNRSQIEAVPVEIAWQCGAPSLLGTVAQVGGVDPKAANTFDSPGAILPAALPPVRVVDGVAALELPPLSFTVLSH
jgi:alpha-N-arabinofuranosidase